MTYIGQDDLKYGPQRDKDEANDEENCDRVPRCEDRLPSFEALLLESGV
jgi:hypothetical protein